DCVTELQVRVRVAPPVLGGDLDGAAELAEQLAALRVDDPLAVRDVRGVGMPCHSVVSAPALRWWRISDGFWGFAVGAFVGWVSRGFEAQPTRMPVGCASKPRLTHPTRIVSHGTGALRRVARGRLGQGPELLQRLELLADLGQPLVGRVGLLR